jgi:hypothetical protein
MSDKLVLILLALLACFPAAVRAADTAGCDLQWQVTPRLEAEPRRLDVSLSFDAGTRSRSNVVLPSRWAAADDVGASITDLHTADPAQQVEPVVGKPAERSIRHRPGERVVLQYQVRSPIADIDAAQPRSPADLYRTKLGARWFEAFGHGLLATLADVPEGTPSRLCIHFDGLAENAWWIGSHGAQQGAAAHLRLRGSQSLATDAVYLGGELQVRERRIDGKPLFVALPPQTAFVASIDAVADRAAQLIDAQHRFWHEPADDHQLLVLHPNHQAEGFGGTSVHRALVMQAAANLAVPGDVFDVLVTHEILHHWFPDRFGPLAYQGRDDEAGRYWFSEGFTDHYTHRILVNAGLWTLADHARVLNAKIDRYRQSPELRADNLRVTSQFYSDPGVAELAYERGEWLALRWHAALRAHGHPGLDAVMRQLMLPPAQAQRQGPMSKPLITHRLLAALRPTLGETPLRDLTTYIDQGQPFEFADTTLGPCFRLEARPGEAPRYQPAAEGLQQRGCRGWMSIGGDAVDPDASAGPIGPSAAATSTVCRKVKGKKTKVCKTVVVRTTRGDQAAAPSPAGKAAKTGKNSKAGKGKAGGGKSGAHAGASTKGKSTSGNGKKAKPKPVQRSTAR